jgi:hypothetical protein
MPLKHVQNATYIHTENTSVVDTKFGTGTNVETVNWVTIWKMNVNQVQQAEAHIEI